MKIRNKCSMSPINSLVISFPVIKHKYCSNVYWDRFTIQHCEDIVCDITTQQRLSFEFGIGMYPTKATSFGALDCCPWQRYEWFQVHRLLERSVYQTKGNDEEWFAFKGKPCRMKNYFFVLWFLFFLQFKRRTFFFSGVLFKSNVTL